MATASEAPATMAEGPTTHTPNQAPRLSAPQLRMLHGPITKNRVRMLRGMAHLEAWDVRRQLTRIFGFGGFDVETISLDQVAERETLKGDKPRWTVVYRAQVRLTIKDTSGKPIARFEDGAAGDSVNQPSLGDAHDMAMKTALSQALKRCAVNLGDQFGLSLYNNGSLDAVVMFSAPHPPEEWKKASPPVTVEDPPVQPEPTPEPQADRPAQQGPATVNPFERLKAQVRKGWDNQVALIDIRRDAKKQGFDDQPVSGPGGTQITFDQLLSDRIDQLSQQPKADAA
ncbi:Rad52/Rad22 family DNA repair protein [Streptomyces albidoflavus]